MLTEKQKKKVKLMLVAAQNCLDNDIRFDLEIQGLRDENHGLSKFETRDKTTYLDWDCCTEKISKIIMLEGEE